MSTRECYAAIQKDNAPHNWTIVRVAEIGKDVEQLEMGQGWDSFVNKFAQSETEILFGAFRAFADDGLGQPRSKIVLVNWIGGRVCSFFFFLRFWIFSFFSSLSFPIFSPCHCLISL